MSTRTLAAAARPCNVIPFPAQRSRRVVPEPHQFDPFDHGCAQAERDLRDCLLRDGVSPADVDDLVSFLLARCDEIIAEQAHGGAL